MQFRILSFFILIIASTSAAAQEKSQTFNIGIERGFEKKNKLITFFADGEVIRFVPQIPHKYWRLSFGIPFRFKNVKFDAGLGFSHNQFNQNIFIIHNPGNFNTSGEYSGLGFDYFLKIPLGIGDDRFEMGPEFRHQIVAAKYSGLNSSLPTSLDQEGKVRSGYFNVGVFANYVVYRRELIEIGLSTSFGYSTIKYHHDFFISTKKLFPYMQFGVVVNTYRPTKD